MSAPLLIDVSHTCHTRARTGVQRVVRSLCAGFGTAAVPVTHDPYGRRWRTLRAWEKANLETTSTPAGKRGAHWPIAAQLRGRASRLLGGTARLPENSGVLVPEIFSATVARTLPALFAASHGPRVAIFHDAIALKLPELTPSRTVARFPGYLQELLAFDGIAAVSEESRTSLLEYWRWLGRREVPVVETIGWAVDFERVSPPAAGGSPSAAPIVLSVGSIEGRKNHLALLEACEQLWARGERFTLHLIGLGQPQTGAAALERIRQLQDAGRPLRYDGPVTDATLNAAYAASAFTVYPSLMEGFGLPVLESLAHGRPCVCSGRGALGESANGGGCVPLPAVDRDSLAGAMEHLLHSPPELARLQAAAAERTFRTWADYVAKLRGWMRALPRRK